MRHKSLFSPLSAALFLTAAPAAIGSADAQQQQRPNIIMLLTDADPKNNDLNS